MRRYKTIPASVSVVCAECGKVGPPGECANEEDARGTASNQGWRIYWGPSDNFLCPICRAKAEEPAKPEPLQACATCDHGSMGTRYRKPDEEPCRSGGVRSRGCTTWVAIGEGEDLPEPAICTQCAHHKMRGKDQAHPWCFHPVNTGKSDFDHTVGALICYKLNNDGKCPDFERRLSPGDIKTKWFRAWDKWVKEVDARVEALEASQQARDHAKGENE